MLAVNSTGGISLQGLYSHSTQRVLLCIKSQANTEASLIDTSEHIHNTPICAQSVTSTGAKQGHAPMLQDLSSTEARMTAAALGELHAVLIAPTQSPN